MSDQAKERPVGRWAEAVGWYGTLRAIDENQLTSAVGRAWQDWYADARNRQVFDDVSRLLVERDLYRKRPRRSEAELEQDHYDLSVPIAEWLSAHPLQDRRVQRSPSGKLWWLSGGLAIAAILALVVLSPLRFKLNRDRASALYQTRVGGLKDVHLQDGSSITLGGQTKLIVTFSAQRRSVSLIEGQAWFKVVHDVRRPFVVAAGRGTIKDVGTAFLVTRESDRVVVAVTEGVVEVSAQAPLSVSSQIEQPLAEKPALAAFRVSRGEELAFGDDGALSAVRSTDTQTATAWTRGRLTFDDQPLRYVIEAVDRYSSRRIVVSPEAGALRFSGIVFNNEIDEWLQSLEAIFPITVEEHGSVVRIEMRSATAAGR